MSTTTDPVVNIRKAIELVSRNDVPQVCWPHVVHPRYATWEVVWENADLERDVYVPCAMLCGGGLVFRRPQQ